MTNSAEVITLLTTSSLFRTDPEKNETEMQCIELLKTWLKQKQREISIDVIGIFPVGSLVHFLTLTRFFHTKRLFLFSLLAIVANGLLRQNPNGTGTGTGNKKGTSGLLCGISHTTRGKGMVQFKGKGTNGFPSHFAVHY